MTPKLALELAAPRTWAASLCPALFAVFYSCEWGLGLSLWQGVLLVAACVLLQSAVNTLNDYFDFVKGTDTADDHVAVTDAVLVYNGIAPSSALALSVGYLAAGAVFGLLAWAGSGPVPIVIGIVGAAVIVLYSGGPVPVSYLPVGEAVSGFVMGGLIPLGAAACADGGLHWDILIFSLPLIIGIALIMMSNNGCDIEKDRRAGRHTLPTYLGRQKTLTLYRVCLVLWLGLAAALPVMGLGPIGLVSAALMAIFAIRPTRRLVALSLKPENRIQQMAGIAAENLAVNLSYTAAFAAAFILETIYA